VFEDRSFDDRSFEDRGFADRSFENRDRSILLPVQPGLQQLWFAQ
jgi:hypothetical protein